MASGFPCTAPITARPRSPIDRRHLGAALGQQVPAALRGRAPRPTTWSSRVSSPTRRRFTKARNIYEGKSMAQTSSNNLNALTQAYGSASAAAAHIANPSMVKQAIEHTEKSRNGGALVRCVWGGRGSPPTPQPPPWPPRPSLPRAGPPPSSTPLFPITPSPLYRPPSPLLSRPFRGAGAKSCQGRGYNAVLWTSYNPTVTRTVKAIEQGTGLFVINVPADFVTGSVVQGAGVSVGRYCHRCRCCVGGGYRKQIVSKWGEHRRPKACKGMYAYLYLGARPTCRSGGVAQG
jgi:hypothetical protein